MASWFYFPSIYIHAIAPQDFEELKQKITVRIQAVLKKNKELDHLISHAPVKNTEGLNQHEVVGLVTIMQNSFLTNGFVAGYQIQNDMNKAGFIYGNIRNTTDC